MKYIIHILFILFLLVTSLVAHAQIPGTSIMDMPTYLGNPNGSYLPIVVNNANRKYDAGKFYNKLDSIAVNGSTIDVYRNGAIAYSVSVPSGETTTTIRTKLGAASSVNSGYLTSADWISFNSKQTSLGYKPADSAKIGVANGIAPTDAGNKIPTRFLPSGVLTYKGVWNAATNTPALSDISGSSGFTYIVSTAGTQNLGSGSISYTVGDQIIHNGSVFEKTPNQYPVNSVNGFSGTVVLNAGSIDTTADGTKLWVSRAEKTLWSGKQAALGFTPLSNAAGSVSNSNLASGIDASKLTTGTLPKTRIGAYTGDVTKAASDTVLTVQPGLDANKLGAGRVNNTELGFLDGVTDSIQKQLNSKIGTNSPSFTGTPTAPTAAVNDNSTQLANTLFVNRAISNQPGLNVKQASVGYRLAKFVNDSILRMRTLVLIGATVDSSSTDSLLKITITGSTSGGTLDTLPTSGSNNGITSNGTYKALLSKVNIAGNNFLTGGNFDLGGENDNQYRLAVGQGSTAVAKFRTTNTAGGVNKYETNTLPAAANNRLFIEGFGVTGQSTSAYAGAYSDGAFTAGVSLPTNYIIGTTAPNSISVTERLRITSDGRITTTGTSGVTAGRYDFSYAGPTGSKGGFLPPKLTLSERGTVSTPPDGLVVYQTDGLAGWYGYRNSTWRQLAEIGTDGTLTGALGTTATVGTGATFNVKGDAKKGTVTVNLGTNTTWQGGAAITLTPSIALGTNAGISFTPGSTSATSIRNYAVYDSVNNKITIYFLDAPTSAIASNFPACTWNYIIQR